MDISCIVKPTDNKFIDLEGQNFNYWHVLSYGGKWGKNQKAHFWYCRCICGKHKLITGNSLRMGTTKSCGCQFNKREDLTGKRFARWLVIGEAGKNNTRKYRWLCLCDCGNEKIITGDNLKKGESKSCGCLQREMASVKNLERLEGKRFDRLKVVKLMDFEKPAKWLCLCECGKEVIVKASALKSGHTKSCGCLSIEKSIQRLMKINTLRGKEHHCYNHSITDEERVRERTLYGPEIKKWRMDVFERDNFACQCCGIKGVLLNAHHLDGYHWAKDKRFDVNNGVTLCEKCHRSFHKRFGFKNNTKEQFENFITVNKSAN